MVNDPAAPIFLSTDGDYSSFTPDNKPIAMQVDFQNYGIEFSFQTGGGNPPKEFPEHHIHLQTVFQWCFFQWIVLTSSVIACFVEPLFCATYPDKAVLTLTDVILQEMLDASHFLH